MKYLLLAAALAFTAAQPVYAEPETKKVCVDKMDKGKPVLDKQGKPQQTCKEIKVHKKLEGTKVEGAKKDQAKK